MTLARSLLLFSLAANAAFAAYFAFRPRSLAAVQTAQSTTPSAARPSPASPDGARPRPSPGLWEALDAEALPTLIARLRAAGFSPSAIRAVAGAKLRRPYTTRLQALRQGADDVPY